MGALCSKQFLEKAGRWPCPVPGGEGPSHSLDRRIGNWDKVPLNLTPYTPMAYRRKGKIHFCFFVIQPEVAAQSGVVFTGSNAAGTMNQRRGEGLAGLNNIKFDVIRSTPRPWDRAGWVDPVQAEILVPDSIPFPHVSHIAFMSDASMDYAQYLCESFSHPKFSVNAQIFTNSPKETKKNITFAFVEKLLLTYSKAGQNMIYSQKNEYSKDVQGYLKIEALINALPGTQGKVLLQSISSGSERIVGIKEFPRSDEYWHICDIAINRLPIGVYLIRYYLDDLIWAARNFEVVP